MFTSELGAKICGAELRSTSAPRQLPRQPWAQVSDHATSQLGAIEKPDFITINRFRNRLKDEINNIFTHISRFFLIVT